MNLRAREITGVVSTSEVIGGILLSTDELFRVEKLTVSSVPHFINDGRFKVDEHSARDVLPRTSFTEKGVESVISATDCLVAGHLAIRLQEKQN